MTRRAIKSDRKAAAAPIEMELSTSLPALLDKGGKSDSTFRQFLYDLSVVGTHLESARQYLAERLGVTAPQYNIVMVIARSGSDAGVSVSDVASRLNVTGAFVTNEVKKLVKLQLLVKRSNPEDGRSVLLSLSAEGSERIQALTPQLVMVNERLFGTLSRDDFQHLARTVGSLVGAFGQTVTVLKALSTNAASEEQQAAVPAGRPRSGAAGKAATAAAKKAVTTAASRPAAKAGSRG